MGFKSILDPEFKYRNAASTDVRKTFERIRDELSELKQKGAVRAVGVSCHDHEALKVAAAHPWVDVVLARRQHAGWRPGVVGTTGARVDGASRPLGHTTPEAAELQALLAEMRANFSGYALGLAVPFLLTALALERFLVWFQRFRPYLAWVERISGAILIVLGAAAYNIFLALSQLPQDRLRFEWYCNLVYPGQTFDVAIPCERPTGQPDFLQAAVAEFRARLPLLRDRRVDLFA